MYCNNRIKTTSMKDNTMYSKDINHSFINSNRGCITHVQYVCTDIYTTSDCITDWKAEWGRQSPVMKNQLLGHQAGFKYQWVSYFHFYMAYSANFDALNNTQMKFQIGLGKEKRNLSQSAEGPNHTSGLTDFSKGTYKLVYQALSFVARSQSTLVLLGWKSWVCAPVWGISEV